MGSSFKLKQQRLIIWSRYAGLLVIGLLAACESMVGIVPESKIGNVESKLVVHGYLSPTDTLIMVYVTESIPVFGQNNSPDRLVVDDAQVVLSRRDIDFVMKYDTSHQAYTLPGRQVGIFTGNTYHLKVQQGDRVVEASTTVPTSPPVIASYQLDSSFSSISDFIGRRDDTLLLAQFTWMDSPGEGNYYRVSGNVRAITSYSEYDDDGELIQKRGRVNVPLSWDTSYGRSDFQSDAGQDGKTMTSPPGRVRVGRPTFWTQNGLVYAEEPFDIRAITLSLHHTDEHYYRYHRSIRQNEDASDNPFAEPALLYTNVRGGLGVFASYTTFSIDIPPPRNPNPF